MNNYLKFEKKIYQVFGLKLGRPLRVKAVLYFFLFGIGTLVFYNLPFIGNLISWMPKSVIFLIPIGSAWLLADVGTENRSPIHFFRSFIGFHYRTLLKRQTLYRGKAIPKENVYEFRNYLTFRIPEEELAVSHIVQSVPVGMENVSSEPVTVENTKKDSAKKQKRIAGKIGGFRWHKKEKVSGSPLEEIPLKSMDEVQGAGYIDEMDTDVLQDTEKVDAYEEQIAVMVHSEQVEGVNQEDEYVAVVKEAEAIVEEAVPVESQLIEEKNADVTQLSEDVVAEEVVKKEKISKKPAMNGFRSFYINRKKQKQENKAVSELEEPITENVVIPVDLQEQKSVPADQEQILPEKVVLFTGKNNNEKEEKPVENSILGKLRSIDSVIPVSSKQNEKSKKDKVQEEVFQLLSLDIGDTDEEKKNKKKKWMVF